MIRGFLKFPALLLALALPASAVPPVALPVSPIEALLVQPDGGSRKVFLLTATATSLRYRETKDNPEVKEAKLGDFAIVKITAPPEFSTALNLYQARRYVEAKAAFAALKVRLDPVSTLPDNPGTLAAFYELECFRKLGDLNGLAEALKKFNKDPLMRENQLRQIEMYIFWDAVRTKNWQQLDALAKDRRKQRLPGGQRAQASYCYALALDARGKTAEALDAYNSALTADLGASEEIARKAALAILKIHAADPAVKEALKTGSPNDRLSEAQSIARLYDLSLGAGEALPEQFAVFLRK